MNGDSSKETGVSPVVAVILLVAVTVILSISVYTFVGGFTADSKGKAVTEAGVGVSTTDIKSDGIIFQSLAGDGAAITGMKFIVKMDDKEATVTILDSSGNLSVSGDSELISGTKANGTGFQSDETVNPGDFIIISLNSTETAAADTIKVNVVNTYASRLIQSTETDNAVGTVSDDSSDSTSATIYTGWSHKKTVTISNPNGNSLSNYALRLNVSYESEMNSTFADLRFGQGDTKLDYHVQSKVDGDHAIVWVEASSLAASADTDITMYFGNSSAQTISNGDATFEMYDDFDDGTFDSEWEQLGPDSSAVFITSGGWARTTDGDGARAYNTTRLDNFEVRTEYYLDNYQCYGNDYDFRVYNSTDRAVGLHFNNGDNCNSKFIHLNGTDSGINPPGSAGTNIRFDMRQGNISLYRDGSYIASEDASGLTTKSYARFHIGRWWESSSSNTRVSVNWVFFRHVAPQEPTYTMGAKQQN